MAAVKISNPQDIISQYARNTPPNAVPASLLRKKTFWYIGNSRNFCTIAMRCNW